MKEKDNNTKFFHRLASSRKKKKKNTCLTDDDSTLHTDNVAIERVVSSYYQNIFTYAVNDDTVDWTSALEGLPSPISSEFFELMALAYTEEEVKTTVFQLNPTKHQARMVFLLYFIGNFGVTSIISLLKKCFILLMMGI